MPLGATFDWTTAYYSASLTGLLMLAGLIISVRQTMWLSYCAQGSAFLVYFAALDGHLTAALGLAADATPLLSAVAGAVACAVGFALCGSLLRREHRLSALKPALLTLSGIALAAPLTLLVVDAATFHRGLAILFWLMIAAQVLPPITWFFLPTWGRNIVMPVTVLIITGLALVGWTNDGGGVLAPGSPPGVRRSVMLWILISGATAMLAMTGIIQRARIRSADRALLAAQRELGALRTAQQAERDMQRARKLATLRGEQLATAAHDIRQPLVALRTSAVQMGATAGAAPAALIDAIDYVESLAENYLFMAQGKERPEDAADGTPGAEGAAPAVTVAAQLILSSVTAMFAGDAQAAGIELRSVDSSLQLEAGPLVLMRIAANCVSNAIKHSHGTVVLVGWRRRAGYAELWVLDNGAGMDPDLGTGHAADAFAATVKGPTSKGSGLGLAIVRELATEQGWQADLSSTPGQGAVMRISGLTVACSS